MSNIIQIKRGRGAPPDNYLYPYELGYDINGKQLYIGEPKTLEDGKLGTTSKLIEQYVSLPSTTLMKPRRRFRQIYDENGDKTFRPSFLEIKCSNLVPERKYTIELYTLQRYQGRSAREWRHPSDADDSLTGEYIGYKALSQANKSEGTESPKVPAPPDWMGNGGILKTEWEFVAEETEETIQINLSSWILDLLKPKNYDENGIAIEGDYWVLLGVQKNKNYKSPRLFQFRIRDEFGVHGTTDSTLRIGDVSYIPEYQETKEQTRESGANISVPKPVEGHWAKIGYVSIVK